MRKKKHYYDVMGAGARIEKVKAPRQGHDIFSTFIAIADRIIDMIMGVEATEVPEEQVTAHYYAKSKVRDNRNQLDKMIDNILGLSGPHDPTEKQTDGINLMHDNDETFTNKP